MVLTKTQMLNFLTKMLDNSQENKVLSKGKMLLGIALILVQKDIITPEDVATIFPELG